MVCAAVVPLLSFCAACGSGTNATPADGATGPDGDFDIVVSEFAVTENPANSLSYFVTWKTNVPIHTGLYVDCGDEYKRTFRDDQAKTDHAVFVMALADGWRCAFTAYPRRDDVGGLKKETIARVGNLPPRIPDLTVNVVEPERMQPGWTLWSAASAAEALDLTIVVIDELGRYRWYYVLPTERAGAGAEVVMVDGNILIGNAEEESQIASWQGYPIWKLDHPAHHDLTMSPFNENHVLTLGHSAVNCNRNEHTAVELDMETRQVVWEWRICEYITPRVDYPNWSHLNTIEPFPGERAVLISSRNQDALYKVDRDTGDLVWALGMDGDFDMDPSAYFLRQHSPEILDDGTILLLDNGLSEDETRLDGLPAREYTRVLQFELTFDANGLPDRANVVWEYADTSIFAVNRSDADRLANGNTLIHYVSVGDQRRTILREVTMDGEIVWDVNSPPNTCSYRSERIEPHYGHIIY